MKQPVKPTPVPSLRINHITTSELKSVTIDQVTLPLNSPIPIAKHFVITDGKQVRLFTLPLIDRHLLKTN